MRIARIACVAALVTLAGGSIARALDLLPASLPDALVGDPYSFQLQGDEGCSASYAFSLASGRLPAGLSIASNGLLAGTPTEAGVFQFYGNLSDGCGSPSSQVLYTLIVAQRLEVTTAALGPIRAGMPFSTQLTAVGGGSQAWSVRDGALPAGLTLSPAGLLSGTPTAASSSTFTIGVSDARRLGTRQFTLVVTAPLALATPAAKRGEVGVRYAVATGLAGGAPPFAWTIASGSLPGGLALDPASGAIAGTPQKAGAFVVSLAVSSGDGATASTAVRLAIAPHIAITTTRLAPAVGGRRFVHRIATGGGVAPLIWRVSHGRLPAGLRLAPSTGVLSGSPRAGGAFTVTVADSLGATAARSFSLVVKPRSRS